MRNNHKAKKLAMRVAAMGLALVMVISLVDTMSLNASAAVSLRGIEKIKNTGFLSILEIVPVADSGSIGYYVGGQEPTANWYNDVGNIEGSEARKAHADALIGTPQKGDTPQKVGKLQAAGLMSSPDIDASTAATNYPLTYKGEYVEYKPWDTPDGVDIKSLPAVKLAKTESQIVKGNIQPCTNGTGGDYTKYYNYQFDTSPDAKFIENAAYYEYAQRLVDTAYYYHVDFEQVHFIDGQPAEGSTDINIDKYLEIHKEVPLYTQAFLDGLPYYVYEGTLKEGGSYKVDIEINNKYGYYIAIPDYTTISNERTLLGEAVIPTDAQGVVDLEAIAGQTIYEADATNGGYTIAKFSATDKPYADSSKQYYAQCAILPITDFSKFAGKTIYEPDTINGGYISVTCPENFTPPTNKTYYTIIKAHSYFANTVPGKSFREADTAKGEVPFFKTEEGFRYVDDGSGDYNFVQSSNGSVEKAIAYDVVYVDGGYANNEWFKRYVLDIDDTTAFDTIDISVTSVTPNDSRLTAASISSYDLVVVSAGFNLEDPSKALQYTNDIKAEVYNEIVKMPRVVDTSFNAHSTLSNSNLVKLKNGMDTPSVTAENVYYFAPTILANSTEVKRLATNQFHTAIFISSDNSSSSPYAVIADEIKYENMLRDSSQELLSTEISIASCFRYVINPYRVINKKTKLNVLDIQPVPRYDETTDETNDNGPLTVATVLSWLPQSMQDQLATKDANGNIVKNSAGKVMHNISITHMSTAALVGKIEDITEQYDLIYIGTAASSNDTSYLNTHLDAGYQYANIGKAVNTNILVRGLLKTEVFSEDVYASTRYSGNDLTPAKRDELIAFAAARMPIVVAEELVSGDGTVQTTNETFNVTLELTEDKSQITPKITFNSNVSPYSYKIVSYKWEYKTSEYGSVTSLGTSATASTLTPKDGYFYRCTVRLEPTVASTGAVGDTATSQYYRYDATYGQIGDFPNDGSSWVPSTNVFGQNYFYGRKLDHDTDDLLDGTMYVESRYSGTLYSSQYTSYYQWYKGMPGDRSTPEGSRKTNDGSFTFPESNTYYWCEITISYNRRNYTVVSPAYQWIPTEVTFEPLGAPSGTSDSGTIPIGKYAGGSGNLALEEKKVDVNSLMYFALDDALSNTDANIFSEAQLGPASRTEVNEQKLVNALNLSRPTINMSEANQPPRYDPQNLTVNGTVGGNCGGNLEFKFQIENITDPDPANTRYSCNLYIDQNGDGRHSDGSRGEKNELIPGIMIEAITDGGTTKRITNGTLQADENITYRVTRGLNSGNANQFSGIVAWKLEIVKEPPAGASDEVIEAAENVHASKKGYTYIQPTAPTELRVLQVLNSNDLFNYGGAVNLATPAEPKDSNGKVTAEWEDTYTGDLTEFQRLYKQLYNAGMYNITVETTTVNALNYSNGIGGTQRTTSSIFTELSGYNMIILGFHDCYGNLKENAANAIVQYIGTGKSLLFTHDTTSYWNNPKYTGEVKGQRPGWAYVFNQIIRDKVGLDRYGVTNTEYGRVQTYAPSPEDDEEEYEYKYGLVATGIEGEIDTEAEVNALEQAGYTVAYMPGEKDRSAPETQGYTNSTVARNLNKKKDGNKETDAVSQVNEGQITEYPYDLPKDMRIEKTHNQYYQLNMNADDVVVWYCLGGEKTSSQYDDYSDEKNDASNAYYIYNRGNITYSGAGHVESLSSQEAMLFVNTMIAAYRAGTGAAGVSFRTAADDPASTLLFPVQIADETDEYGKRETYTLSGEQSTYFKISDRNLTEGNTLSVELYYEVADQTTTNREDGAIKIRDDATGNYTPYVVNVSITDDDISRADTTASADPDNLISDVLYKMVIPPAVLDYVTRLQGDGKIYLVATTTIHSDAGDTTYRSFDDLTLKKLGLLRLE